MKKFKRILINVLCGFIPGRKRRKTVRIKLNSPIRKWTDFAKSFSNKKHPSVKHTYGYRCANIVISLDKKWVFKFPAKGDGYAVSLREKRITDALRKYSPLKIPEMEILDFNGIAVRKYEYIDGVGFLSLPTAVQDKYINKIAKQLATFLYEIGKSDPIEIRDLKPNKSDKPSVMHGWCQNDLWDNFILDAKTFDVIGIIDWEGAGFNDFYLLFTGGTKNNNMKGALLREYINLCKKH